MGVRNASSCFRLAGADCANTRLDALEASVAALQQIVGTLSGAGGAVVASPLILKRATQAISRDGSNNALTTITPSLGSLIDLTLTGATVYGSGGITPFISTAGAVHGQIVMLCHSSGTASNLQFNTGIAGSKVRLISNTNKSVTPEDYITFMYNAIDDVWDQIMDVALLT